MNNFNCIKKGLWIELILKGKQYEKRKKLIIVLQRRRAIDGISWVSFNLTAFSLDKYKHVILFIYSFPLSLGELTLQMFS
jgi:hypothetical protein